MYDSDKRWHDRLSGIKGARPIHAYLPGMSKQIRRRYPPHMLATAEAQLLALRSEINDKELNAQIKQLYSTVIDEHLLKGQLLSASWSNNIEQFKAINTSLYGKLDPLLWEATGAFLKTRLDRRLAKRQMNLVFTWPERVMDSRLSLKDYIPRYGKFLKLKKRHNRLPWIKRLHDLLPDKPYITMAELVTACQTAINDVVEAPQIRIVRKESAVFRMRVAHGSKLLIYGRDDMLISRRRAEGLAMNHEIGTHILRRQQSYRAPIALFRIGLDNYEIGEEGLGVLVEMLSHPTRMSSLRSKRFLTILMRYYAAGLMAGFGGKRLADSRKIQRHCQRYFYLWLKTSPLQPDTDSARREARLRARILMRSLLRGVGHNNQQAYFGRPACYLPAFIDIFNMLADAPDRKALEKLFIGHFNPLKSDHQLITLTNADIEAIRIK